MKKNAGKERSVLSRRGFSSAVIGAVFWRFFLAPLKALSSGDVF
jgi:hypothetical protein